MNFNPEEVIDYSLNPNESVQDKIARVSKRIINGLEVKYDEELHIPLLISLFKKGRSISFFLVAAEISEACFHKWCNEHTNFKIAYEVAKHYAKIWWELFGEYGAHDPSFNTKYWQMIMRNRFDYTEHRKLAVPGLKGCIGLSQQIQCIVNHLADGNLTATEANQLSNLILAAMKVEDYEVQQKRIEKLESVLKEHGLNVE